MDPRPCQCSEPNPACRRGGQEMIGRLWELCRGVNCDAATSLEYRRAWDGLPPSWEERRRTNFPCVSRGGPTGEVRDCPSCGGRVRLKLLACDRHGNCTAERRAEGVAWCPTCADYRPGPRPFAGPVVRNLLYHVWPVKGRGVWQRNVAQLLRRIDLFNGRKVVAVVTGRGADPAAAVRAAFWPHVREFIELPNDPRRRETQTWDALWSRVFTDDPDHVTFYAHSKGVRRHVGEETTIHRWADVMYESLLDYYPLVEEMLQRYPIAGSFKKNGQFFAESRGTFHYSGTFYWVRQCLAGPQEVAKVDRFWAGAETWPGVAWTPGEAGRVFFERNDFMDLYSADYWAREVAPEWERWKEENAKWKTHTGASS